MEAGGEAAGAGFPFVEGDGGVLLGEAEGEG
jgi:hypothetical protein